MRLAWPTTPHNDQPHPRRPAVQALNTKYGLRPPLRTFALRLVVVHLSAETVSARNEERRRGIRDVVGIISESNAGLFDASQRHVEMKRGFSMSCIGHGPPLSPRFYPPPNTLHAHDSTNGKKTLTCVSGQNSCKNAPCVLRQGPEASNNFASRRHYASTAKKRRSGTKPRLRTGLISINKSTYQEATERNPHEQHLHRLLPSPTPYLKIAHSEYMKKHTKHHNEQTQESGLKKRWIDTHL